MERVFAMSQLASQLGTCLLDTTPADHGAQGAVRNIQSFWKKTLLSNREHDTLTNSGQILCATAHPRKTLPRTYALKNRPWTLFAGITLVTTPSARWRSA